MPARPRAGRAPRPCGHSAWPTALPRYEERSAARSSLRARKRSTSESRIPGYPVERVDFREAHLVAQAEATADKEILSFDRSLDKIETVTDLRRCHRLQSTYADLQIGIVDASILALVERLEEDKVATLDHRHFAAVQLAGGRALELLP